MRVPDMKGDGYLKAYNLAGIFEGETEVVFYDTSERKYISAGIGANITPYFLSELKRLLGEENVVLK